MSQTELKSILYVEDDLHVRTTATLVLEVIGTFTVRACSSGREALRVALDFRPDLILLDVMMPGLDGLDTLELLRRLPHLADTPAVFVTGAAAPDEIERYLEAGAIGVISKPLVPLRLAGQLHSLWEQRMQAAF
jgi:CheY-like chemotaxis protein